MALIIKLYAEWTGLHDQITDMHHMQQKKYSTRHQ